MSMYEVGVWSAVSSLTGTLAALAVEIALLVVVATTVRRHRPHAFGTLLASALITLVSTLLSAVSYALLPLVLARDIGIEKLPLLYAAIGLGFALVRALAGVLLVVGVARLATPPTEYPVGAVAVPPAG